MGIRDRNIDWRRHLMYIPATNFQGYTTGAAGVDDGAPVIVEHGSLGFSGVQINADGDSVTHIMRFPAEWDVSQTIGVRVYWTAVGTLAATDAQTWIFLYDQIDPDEAIIAPATALDTAIATLDLYGSTTDSILKRTARGIINADTFDQTARDGMFSFNIEADAHTDFAADEVFLLGVEFDYIPNLTQSHIEDIDDRIAND